MATLADSLVSSAARKLPIRKRPDLSARLHRYQGRAYWVVKEPMGLNYFRFQEEEFAILNMLDGNSSLDEIKDRFEAEFPPQKITVEELQQFLGMLHRSGLVITGAPGQGTQLLKRFKERKKREWLGMLSNLLALRFKGIDPNKLLDWMDPKFRFCFTRMGIFTWFAVCLSALMLVLVQFHVFQAKLPSFHQFFGPSNWFWLGLVLALTKVCHEFGHGLSCKHFGGECHEIGVMLLVLTPCLYCNVSDSWMLPNKWRRAMIGAAGMYVELFIASVCTFVWWFTEPGLLNNLCLSTMFVCSVSTVMFNANPLLRYDGYYILADITEIPNLRQKATKILTSTLTKYCLGLDEPEDPFLPKRNKIFFITYTIGAVIYRWVVLFSILLFLYHVFKPYGLQIIGQMIGTMSIVGLVVVPLWKVGKFFYIPGRIDRVKKPRFYASLAIFSAILAAIAFVPLPHHVLATALIRPLDGETVYVNKPGGTLKAVHVRPGQTVQPGQELAELENKMLETELLQIQGSLDQSKALLSQLETTASRNNSGAATGAASRMPSIEKTIASLEAQLADKKKQIAELTLRAPKAGTIIPPPAQPSRPGPEGSLPGMSGTPFSEKNIGMALGQDGGQNVFCIIGQPQRWEAIIVIDQSDIEFVGQNQSVEVLLNELQLHAIATHIKHIEAEPMKDVPQILTNKTGGDIATESDPITGREKPQSVHYQAYSNELPAEYAEVLRNNFRGQAKIRTAPRSIGARFVRFVKQTFNFSL